MFSRILLSIVVFLPWALYAQEDASVPEGTPATTTTDDSRMLTPPPVSGAAYPNAPTSEERSNYLRAGLTFSTAYTDNLLGGTTTKPISDISYSIWPSIALDETTPRLHSVLTYSPGFTFYQKTSGRNQADQNLGLDFSYRLSPHVTVSFRDTFQKSSNVFNQQDLAAASISGSAQAPTVAVIAPVADQLNNRGNGGISYQFSPNSMVGASGTFTNLHYPNPAQVPGLYDSNSVGGSAFYNRRLSKKVYIGANYQYQRVLMYPTGSQSETQTHTIYLFYTIYLKPTLSVSISGGPQYADVGQAPFPNSRTWSPSGTASVGWQAGHTAFSASYSRLVTAGGGLLGAFNSNSASGSIRQQLTRNWNAGVSANYSIYKTLGGLLLPSNQGGHTVSGSASLQRKLGEHLNAEAGYTRLHQSYSNIAVIAAAPDTNREWISISYQFAKPLGR